MNAEIGVVKIVKDRELHLVDDDGRRAAAWTIKVWGEYELIPDQENKNFVDILKPNGDIVASIYVTEVVK